MTELYGDFEQIWRLCKVLKGSDTPYWMGKKPNEYIYEYPKGHKEFLQKSIDERLKKWQEANLHVILNEVN